MDEITDEQLNSLSSGDLEAVISGNLEAMSNHGLEIIAGRQPQYQPFFSQGQAQPESAQNITQAPIGAAVGTPIQNTGSNPLFGIGMGGQESIDNALAETADRESRMTQLRETNPFLADQIQNMSIGEAIAVGAGERVATLLRGMGIMDMPDAAETQAFDLLRDQRSSVGVGQFLGEAAMFVAPGGAAAKVASLAPKLARIPLMATYAMGEGGLMARGDQAEGLEFVARVGLSGVLGGIAGGFLKGAPTRSEKQIVDALALGRRTPEVTAIRGVLDNPNTVSDDILQITNQTTDPHPILQGIRQAAEEGDDVLPIAGALMRAADDALENNQAARYILDGADNLRANPAVRSVSSSWDEGIATTMSGATPADRNLALKVLDLFKRGRGQGAAWAGKHRPQNPVGDEILRQYNFLRGVMRDTGRQLNNVSKTQLRGADVDLSAARSGFLDDIAEEGITIADDGLDFSNSSFFSRLAKPQRAAINDTYQALFKDNIDGLAAHRMKGSIDEMVNFDKAAGGLGLKAENILKGARTNINDAIGLTNETYRGLNSIYSEIIGSLNLFQKGIGASVDLADDTAGSIIAQKVNTLMSNNVGRGNLQSALESMARLARKNGGSFDIDPYTQVAFIQALESRFGIQAKRSLGGIIETVLGNKGLKERGLDKIAELMQSDEAAIKSMETLLRQGN